MIAGVVIGAVLVAILLTVVAGGYFFVLPMLKETTTTTTTSTTIPTTTSTSTTSTSTTSTSTSSTTTTTLATFYVCESKLQKTEMKDCMCCPRDRLGKSTGECKYEPLLSKIEYALDEDIITGVYRGNTVKIYGEKCIYKIVDISFTVSQLKSCTKPIGEKVEFDALFVDPN